MHLSKLERRLTYDPKVTKSKCKEDRVTGYGGKQPPTYTIRMHTSVGLGQARTN